MSVPIAVRKLLAVLLLLCVVISIPATASPVRICFLELSLNLTSEEAKCCSDCTRENELPEPCCSDLEALPDAPAPQVPVELPAAVITDLHVDSGHFDVFSPRISCNGFSESAPVRGPLPASGSRPG